MISEISRKRSLKCSHKIVPMTVTWYIKYVMSVTKSTICWCCKNFFGHFKLHFSFLLLDTRGNRLIIHKALPLVCVGNAEGAKCVMSVTFVTSVTMINDTK